MDKVGRVLSQLEEAESSLGEIKKFLEEIESKREFTGEAILQASVEIWEVRRSLGKILTFFPYEYRQYSPPVGKLIQKAESALVIAETSLSELFFHYAP